MRNSSKIIKLQPSAYTDQIVGGQELSKLPYPFYVTESGAVQGADVFAGTVSFVIGFQNDLHRHEIDIWWKEVVKDPQLAVGRYLVTTNKDGDFGVHQTAIATVEVKD